MVRRLTPTSDQWWRSVVNKKVSLENHPLISRVAIRKFAPRLNANVPFRASPELGMVTVWARPDREQTPLRTALLNSANSRSDCDSVLMSRINFGHRLSARTVDVYRRFSPKEIRSGSHFPAGRYYLSNCSTLLARR